MSALHSKNISTKKLQILLNLYDQLVFTLTFIFISKSSMYELIMHSLVIFNFYLYMISITINVFKCTNINIKLTLQ